MIAAALLAVLGPGASALPRRPNVVIIDICSARADHFGFHGYARDTTPGLDALAKETAVFEQAIAQSSWCLPNYASLFTGQPAEVHGRYTLNPGRRSPAELPTLAEKLKSAGYATAAFTGGVFFLPAWDLGRGFDLFENDFSTTAALPSRFSNAAPKALAWLDSKAEAGPAFLYLSADDLHAPYQSDEPDRYDPGYAGVAHDTATLNVRIFRKYNQGALDPGDPDAATVAALRADPRHLRHIAAHYDAALRGLDRDVSAFIARLKKSRRWKDTVVIVTADHGEMLGEKGLLGHTESLYEGVLRVPLLVHLPGGDGAGRRYRQPVERVDLMPTLLEAAGVDPSGLELPGSSLLPLLRDPLAPWREFAFASSKRSLPSNTPDDLAIDERVVRSARWKLLFYLYKGRFELYDLSRDPLELNDASVREPEVLHRMAFELLRRFELARPHAPGLPLGKAAEEPAPFVAPRSHD